MVNLLHHHASSIAVVKHETFLLTMLQFIDAYHFTLQSEKNQTSNSNHREARQRAVLAVIAIYTTAVPCSQNALGTRMQHVKPLLQQHEQMHESRKGLASTCVSFLSHTFQQCQSK